MIAKLDLIEGDGGRAVPVDYKKGSPQPDGTPWPSDEVQVCQPALLLREHGYQCDHAGLWYAETASGCGWSCVHRDHQSHSPFSSTAVLR